MHRRRIIIMHAPHYNRSGHELHSHARTAPLLHRHREILCLRRKLTCSRPVSTDNTSVLLGPLLDSKSCLTVTTRRASD